MIACSKSVSFANLLLHLSISLGYTKEITSNKLSMMCFYCHVLLLCFNFALSDESGLCHEEK